MADWLAELASINAPTILQRTFVRSPPSVISASKPAAGAEIDVGQITKVGPFRQNASGRGGNIRSVRWSNLSLKDEETARLPGYRDEATVRHFEAPDAIRTRFYEVRAKSILNRVPAASRMPFRWTVNTFRGCSHACHFCFARPTHKYLDFNAAEDFEREIVVKVNAPELLRAELARPSWQGEHVALGTNTDPYQWVEGRYKLMRGIWEAMRDASNPCSVLTKSPLLLRDLDLMKQINQRTEFSAALSVPTLDEKAWRATEPHTPNPRARLEAVAELTRTGIRTGVLIAPLMPGVNDAPEQVQPILELAVEAGAAYVTGIGLHLRGEVKDLWFQWLAEHRPDLLERYQRLYRRGAYAPPQERERLAALVGGFQPRASGLPTRFHRGQSRIKSQETGHLAAGGEVHSPHQRFKSGQGTLF
jgi:DNA repair photolyase